MSKQDKQDKRIEAIVGDTEDLAEGVAKFYQHLKAALRLPCEVTGIEDFRWEEFYILGPGDAEEYKQLRKKQPSYRDVFELLAIEEDADSAWMMCGGEDLGAQVRRKADGKEFCLGLSELEAVDKKSRNHQLLDDYSVWFVNAR